MTNKSLLIFIFLILATFSSYSSDFIFESNDAAPHSVNINLENNSIGLVLVKGGKANIGCASFDEVLCAAPSMPKINVEIKTFYLMDTEVSMELWSECVQKGFCKEVQRDKNWVGKNLPAVNVSWNDIVENFIPWLNSISSTTFRLPTEYEWEYAASEGSDRKYIWGNNFGINKASCANCGSKFDGRQPAPVKYFPKNSWGLYGMLGNVEEWTADCWTTNHVTTDQYKFSATNKNCQFRTIKGASWVHQDWALIPYDRTYSAEHRRFEFVGFRLAADYEQK